MRRTAVVLAMISLVTVAIGAQGRGRQRSQGIPPGHLPPPGQCRVWYEGVPPGRQPAPTSCREAERIAARDRNARVIYGNPDRDRWRDRDDRGPYTNRYPDGRERYGYEAVAFDNGYRDGVERGRADARARRAFDPERHRQYRSADRGYNRRFGSKLEYQDDYRDGFRAGYREAYRAINVQRW
jgi:hypothetical protein